MITIHAYAPKTIMIEWATYQLGTLDVGLTVLLLQVAVELINLARGDEELGATQVLHLREEGEGDVSGKQVYLLFDSFPPSLLLSFQPSFLSSLLFSASSLIFSHT